MAAYFRPKNLPEALKILSSEPVIVAAGCTDLFPATERSGLQGVILDITAIKDLCGLEQEENRLRIGATTTWSEIAHADLPPAFDALRQAAGRVGAGQIQNAGTIGGNLCNASPAADGVPPLLALNAEVVLSSLAGERRLPLSEFINGARQTALHPKEILTAVIVPPMAGRSLFSKLGARDSLVISIAMVAVRLEQRAGRVSDVAVAVGACSPVAVRLTALEQALRGLTIDRAVQSVNSDLVHPALHPVDDIRADASYRKDAVVTMIRRALTQLGGTSA